MKIYFPSILIVLLTVFILQAQSQSEFLDLYCTKPHAKNKFEKSILQPHSYDVIFYDIYLDWYQVLKNENRNYSGNVLIRAKVDTASSLNQMKLDCGLSVDSVTQNGAAVPSGLSSNVLTINLNRSYNKGEIFEVKIYFKRTRTDNLGFYYYAQSSETFEHLAYTMTQPSDARYWFPCYDDPSDKADSARITIKVPNGYTAGSNGLLRSKTTNGDSTTFVWVENNPIATYLLVVTASKYSSFSQFVNSMYPPNEQIEIQHYFWKSDSTQAVHVARNLPTMMQCFETYYGKYPFAKYGHAYVRPFSFGGMEHQTLSTINRSWITIDGQSGIAHELAHMWWGDLVTCETWKDIWLNEGFATFSEDLYREFTQGKDVYHASMTAKANYYHNFNPGYAIYNPSYIFNAAISYYKGALVLNMMRFVLGDSLFFKSLMDYKISHLYSTATTEDFKNSVSATIGSDFSYFINQWIYQPNHPQYAYNWNVINSGSGIYNLNVFLKQKQMHYPLYKMPFEIKVQFANGDTTVRIMNDAIDQSFSFVLSQSPTNIVIDPNNYILKQINRDLTLDTGSSSTINGFYLYQNYPNPFNGNSNIKFQIAKFSHVTLKVYDILGREIATLVDEIKDPGTYHFPFSIRQLTDHFPLPSGIYYYQLRAGSYVETKKMILMK